MLEPQYILTPRLVSRLARGELAVEPALGLVRVAAVRPESQDDPDDSFVRVRWCDEHSPASAAGRYPAHQSLLVQMPAFIDRLLVRRGIDLATRNRREVTDDVARLIASHLQPGPRSALHQFVVDGRIEEQIFDELEIAVRHRRYAREWVNALTRYCLAREDIGPVPRWTRRSAAEKRLASAGVDTEALKRSGDNRDGRDWYYPDLLASERMPSDVAAQLIDAAFLLGLTVARHRMLPALAERRLDELADVS